MRRFPDSPAQKPAGRAVASALRITGASAGVAFAAAVLAVLIVPDLRELALDSPLEVDRTGAQAMTKQQQLRVESLDQLRKTVFFDAATHKPKLWYAISATGELELFTAPGRHPDRPETLMPITASLVQQLERRLKAQQQERAAEAERRAATARADAEIAQSRRAHVSASAAPVQPPRPLRGATASVSAPAAPVQPEEQSGKATTATGTVAAREVPVLEAPPPSTSPRRSEAPVMSSASPPLPPPSRHDGATIDDASGRPSVTPRADLYDDAPVNEEAARAKQYNALVSDARALIDARRYGEARARAQRAIYVDPRRMAARTLWAEAQTKLDRSSPSAFARRSSRPRWSY